MDAKPASTTSVRGTGADVTFEDLQASVADRTVLLPTELFWRDHQKWLEEKGYLLRPRYRPGWVPSWQGTKKDYWRCEDGITMLVPHLLDAIRISDGEMVMLKRISRLVHPYEVQISRYFSAEPLASHPHNHCVPIYDVLDIPDEEGITILAMPLLRYYNDPRIKSVGEAVEYFRQVFEGLQFMHQCHVAHRDCMNLNIMMDPKPTFPDMFHPLSDRAKRSFSGRARYFTRTARPTKYFLIDFGLSQQYKPEDLPPQELPIFGGDKTVPEFQHPNEACDPFPTDIYYIGNMIREDFLQKMRGVEFMVPLVTDMVQADPSMRPTIDQVVIRFEKLSSSLPWWKLRSRLLYNDEVVAEHVIRNVHHFFRTAAHIITFRSSLPRP